ncbi:tyrosine-type recombinase/integrase [Neptunomonas sp.]|uniref:tyrosine-type recombinase/integrase n=1 Tax=Neptunomonas sp. TaxID=1971898 RepID=UPI0025D4A2F1|nr:tyrosine-type recombinase/integrase [Neptunomonas sp.]
MLKRHSFASHFVMNGGSIVTLQRVLGHSSVKTTMRYAHLCPDFLNDAIKYNPMV